MTKTIAEILAVAENPEFTRVATAKIALVSQALRDEHAELDARLKVLIKERDTVDFPDEQLQVAQRLHEIEAELEASTIEFRFRSIGHRAWRDLLRDHPPTQKQIELNTRVNPGQSIDHNPDSFPHAAMAASCADPVMTVDDVKRLEASPLIDVASWMALWSGCIQANVASALPKSRAAGSTLLRNGAFAAIAVNGESPGASSSDG